MQTKLKCEYRTLLYISLTDPEHVNCTRHDTEKERDDEVEGKRGRVGAGSE
jgi:hypothetical protein